MIDTLVLCDRLGQESAKWLANGGQIVVCTLSRSSGTEKIPDRLTVETAPVGVSRQASNELDLLASRIACTWHKETGDRFRCGSHYLPHYFEVDVFLEVLEAFRLLERSWQVMQERKPRRLLLLPDSRSVLKDVAEWLARIWKISCEEITESLPVRSGAGVLHRARAALQRMRLEQPWKPRKDRGLIWAYPKIRKSNLIHRLEEEGFSFLVFGTQGTFREIGVRYSTLARSQRKDDSLWDFDRITLPFFWQGVDLGPLLGKVLSRVLWPRFAQSAALARTLEAFDGSCDAVVTPDFLSGENAVIHKWAESKNLPRLGLQHGAPLGCYPLHFSPCYNRGRILVWGGKESSSFYQGHGIPKERLIATGSADNDRFINKFSKRGHGDILFCTLSGFPYHSLRNTLEVNVRLLTDLLSAAAHFPDLEVVAKPHPLQPTWERQILEEILQESAQGPARISSDESLDELLCRATLVATRLSSTAVEAGLAGIPVLHLDYGLVDEPWYTGIMNDPELPRAKTEEDIHLAIANAIGLGRAGMIESARRFAARWEYTDGRSTERVVAAISQAVG